jgi:hypothetical protein
MVWTYPTEASVHSGVISRTDNVNRDRERPNLTWEKIVKKDLKDWSITKELALDRRAEASNSCARTLVFDSSSFIVFSC